MGMNTGKLGRETFMRCIICFTAIVLICTAVLLYSYYRDRNLSESHLSASTESLSLQLANNIVSILKGMEQTNLSASEISQRYASLLYRLTQEKNPSLIYQQLSFQILEQLNLSRYMHFLYVADDHSFSICRSRSRTGYAIRDAQVAQSVLQMCSDRLDLPSGRAVFTAGPDQTILIVRRLFDEGHMRFIGSAVSCVSLDPLRNLFDSVHAEDSCEFALLDAYGQVLMETSPLSEAANQKNGTLSAKDGWNLQRYHLTVSDLELISYTDIAQRNAVYMSGLLRCLAILGITLVAIFVFFWMTYFRTARSSAVILRRMEQISKGQFEKEDTVVIRDNDMRFMYNQLEEMSSKIGQLIDQVSIGQKIRQEDERALLQMKYDLLRQQVNPHFLNNALATISSIAVLHDEAEIAEIAQRLGRYFRASLSSVKSFSSLHEEISILSNYTDLYMKIYPERLDVSYEVESACENISLPSLILLPIMENALVHGMEEKVGTTHIRVCAFIEGKMLRVQIEDDGIGISPEKLSALMKEESTPSGRVGLLNVRRRLQLVYNNKADLHIESEKGKFTRVSIFFPLQFSEQRE